MIKGNQELTERERKIREYYWKCFWSEFSKICIFLIVFMLLEWTVEYFFALFYLMLLRNNGGGLHFKHYISCLLVSFIFLYGAISLATHIILAKPFMYITIFLCALIGYYCVPITSSNRPEATSAQVKKSKRNTVVIISLFLILIYLCPHNTYIYIGYWTIILHILQLLVALITKEVKRNVRLEISF